MKSNSNIINKAAYQLFLDRIQYLGALGEHWNGGRIVKAIVDYKNPKDYGQMQNDRIIKKATMISVMHKKPMNLRKMPRIVILVNNEKHEVFSKVRSHRVPGRTTVTFVATGITKVFSRCGAPQH